MATIRSVPALRTPSLIGSGGDPGTISNPFDQLGRTLQTIMDRRRAEEEEARRRTDAVEVARRAADFRLEQGRALDEAAEAYDGVSPGFTDAQIERYEASLTEFLDNAPEHLREDLEFRLNGDARATYGLAAQEVEIQRTRARALTGAIEAADMAVNAAVSDPAEMETGLAAIREAALALPPSVQAAFVNEQSARVVQGHLSATLRSDPQGTRERLLRGDYDAYVAPEAKDRYINAAGAEMERQAREAERRAREAEARAARQQTAELRRMQVAFAEGRVTREDIDTAFEEGRIDIDGWAGLAVRAEDAARAEREAAAARDLILGGGLIDPTNSDHQDAADGAWRQMLDDAGATGAFTANPGAFRDDMVAFTEQFGIVPDTAITALNALAANGNETQQAGALDAIAAISQAAAPAASAAFPDRIIADATLYASFAEVGMQPDEALARVQAARQVRSGTAQEALRQEADTYLRGLTPDTMATLLQRGFDASPRVPFVGEPDNVSADPAYLAEATADYRRLYRSHFAEHGNADIAHEQAIAIMRRSWGESRVTGEARFMRYPPERFHAAPGGDTDWMGEQLTGALAEVAGGEVANVRLIPDGQTAREAQSGRAPTYRVTYQDAYGATHAAPGRWQFDSSAIEAEAQREGRERLERARAEREAALADLPFRELDMLRWQRDTTPYGMQHRDELDARITAREAEMDPEALADWRGRQEAQSRADAGL